VLLTLGCGATLHAQTPFESKSGEELYRAACVACHGPDGKAQPPSVVGFDVAIPDFTDCSFGTPEPDADWLAVVHDGGPARAFDRRMPAFGQLLSENALLRIIDYVRGFCPSDAWPRGELNLPRALVTEKAFPENETVLSVAISGGESATIDHQLIYERRLGPRSQVELVVPVALEKSGGTWQRGLGDAAVALKHAAFHSLDRGTIFSLAAEVVFPTGKESAGLGKGVTVFEPFVALGQMLPSDGFVQLQIGAELPFDSGRAARETFVRAAIGKSFVEGRFGRTWSPMVELVGARELDDDTKWDVVPQMQVTLSKRQHIMLSAGLRAPLTNRRDRDVQVLAYFLWDWFDGGVFDGWR